MERITPIFPCKSFADTMDFYLMLGFAQTYRQDEPYCYGAITNGEMDIHFAKLMTSGARHAVALVHVPDVEIPHQNFADVLRAKYGRVPTTGFPRLTRPRPGQTRFHLFDPSGNNLIYVNQDEPDTDYDGYDTEASELAQALHNAFFLQDTYVNDTAAAKVLDKALSKGKSGPLIDRARVLAARIELAIALDDTAARDDGRAALAQIALTEAELELYHDELTAPERTERWIWRENA